jgi:hypothetical protein
MKTFVTKASLATAFLLLSPLSTLAQHNAIRPGLVNRGIERLTLLPGPYLLSPARTTPTMIPGPARINADPTRRLMQPEERFLSGDQGSRSLRLLPRRTTDSLSRSGRIPTEPPRTTARPKPESLRFDSTLEFPLTPSLKITEPQPSRPQKPNP